MGRKSIVKIGDVFQIPLSDERKAYGQYVFQDKKNGPIIRVFDYFTKKDEKEDIQKIDTSKLLFLPVYASVYWAVKEHGWTVVGSLSVDDYQFSGFLNFMPSFPPNPDGGTKVKSWFFWDGEKDIELGGELSKKYLDYESTGVYPADLIAERIETGFNAFEYLKKYNRGITKDELKKKYPSIKV